MITFLRSQISSLISTLFDFLITLLFVELVGTWIGLAGVLGNAGGAICNFFLGRFWTFGAIGDRVIEQGIRYVIVWLGYVFISFSLLVMATGLFHIDYKIAKISIAVFLGVTYNYLLQKVFVFKQ